MSYAEGGNVLGGSVRGEMSGGRDVQGGDVLHPIMLSPLDLY